MKQKKLRTVIIGMGKMGYIRYQAMLRNDGFDVVAVCDVKNENMSSVDLPKYTDWMSCINEKKPDAVVVCTVNAVIPDIVCYALKQGMAVFSEKPPGRTLEDALRMQEVQKETGSVLKFGFNHRVHNSIMEAKALIDSKLLGEIVCIRGVYGKAGNAHFEEEWRNHKEVSGGGILLDQGIHMIDLMCYLLHSNLHVRNSNINNLVWKGMNTEDSALAILEGDHGQMVSIHSSAVQWRHKFDMDIICTNGYIALNGLLTNSRSYGEESITYYKKDLAEKTGKLGRPKEHTMWFDEDSSWDIEMEEFYQGVANHKPIENGRPEEAVRVMKIIHSIYQYSEV